TVSEQCRDMAVNCPGFGVSRTEAGMSWTGELTPTAISETYTVEIVYKRRLPPHVWVRVPELAIAKEDYRFTHLYRDGSLCLHDASEWKPWMTISTTIVPWTIEWLFYYEAWRATGSWSGGGEYRIPPKPMEFHV